MFRYVLHCANFVKKKCSREVQKLYREVFFFTSFLPLSFFLFLNKWWEGWAWFPQEGRGCSLSEVVGWSRLKDSNIRRRSFLTPHFLTAVSSCLSPTLISPKVFILDVKARADVRERGDTCHLDTVSCGIIVSHGCSEVTQRCGAVGLGSGLHVLLAP